MDQIWEGFCTYVSPVIAVASVLANWIRPNVPVLGRAVHWMAANGKRTQDAICAQGQGR